MGYTINTITGKVIEDKTVICTGPVLIKEPLLIIQIFAKLKALIKRG